MKSNSRDTESNSESEVMLRAVWLSFIGGLTQEEIAQRLGISRIKVSRLITQARRNNIVHVFIDGLSPRLIRLEDKIKEHFELDACHICLSTGSKNEIEATGNTAARLLYEYISQRKVNTVGLGNGRTIASMVSFLPKIYNSSKIRFVSLSGSLMRTASANPFDMIYKICEKVHGEGYFMPAPFLADSVEDKKIIMQQKSMKRVLEIAKSAELMFCGIGALSKDSFTYHSKLINDDEFQILKKNKAVAEILGTFIDSDGRPIDVEINQRAISYDFYDLKKKKNIILAGGKAKVDALNAVLSSSIPSEIVIDEILAETLIKKYL